MFLQKVIVQNLGPFYAFTELELDRRVTVLTGPNDTGKSSLLRFVKLFLEQGTASEMDVNQDHIQEGQHAWHSDGALYVHGQFFLDSTQDLVETAYRWTAGDTVEVRRKMARDQGQTDAQASTKSHGVVNWKARMPVAIIAPSNNEVREKFEIAKPNELELALLEAAFGAPFKPEKYLAMNPVNLTRALHAANTKLNNYMERVMPTASSLRFVIQGVAGHPDQFSILLHDRHDGITPFGLRGSGLKKMITLLAELLTRGRTAHHRLVLLDEPENSLHADAQHLLREFLFALTEDKKTQVIYATHSPCMVNPMRPEQVRLLRREMKNGKAISVVENRPCAGNFFALRSSLGVSPADSLLYAPVTIVIEGDTEFACMAPIILKLEKSDAFKDARKLLSLCHFLDGMGGSFELFARLAKSQGARVIIFLDGDMRKRVEQSKVQEKHPDAKLILLPDRTEFEELVPIKRYFDALSLELGSESGEVLMEKWHQWLEKNPDSKKKVFSKQVWDYVEVTHEEHYKTTKPEVMRKAIELSDPEEINVEPFRKLMTAIREHLSGTSF